MLPTRAQVLELKRAFSAARKAFNWTVHQIKEEHQPVNTIALITAFRQTPRPAWASGDNAVSTEILKGAVKQACNAYKTNFAKQRKDPSHTFEVHYRNIRKTNTEVLAIEKDRPDGKTKTSTLLRFRPLPYAGSRPACLAFFGNNLKATGGIRLQSSHAQTIQKLVDMDNRLREDAKIQYDKRRKAFYFIFLEDVPVPADPDPEFRSKRVVATDPGCKVFQTWYSPDGSHGELLKGADVEIKRRCLALDELTSRIARRQNANKRNRSRRGSTRTDRRSARQRYQTTQRLKRKLRRDRARLTGWMESAHYDAANFLLNRFDVIVQPWLRTKDLCEKTKRAISCKTARKMLTWSHCKFRERLQSSAQRYAGRRVLITGEPGTSRTCGLCGFFATDLTLKDRQYLCPSCGMHACRDVNGARNNLLAEYGRLLNVPWDGASD